MSDKLLIPMNQIDADDNFNCRGHISTIDVTELANDIKLKGLLQPVIVMKYPEDSGRRKKYRLIGGFRRYTAHILNQATDIWASEVPYMDEESATVMNLSENLNRQDLTIIQEANALKRLRDLGCGRAETAERLGRTPGWVQVRYMLLDLPKDVQLEVEAGVIKQTEIRELYSVLRAVGEKACINAAKQVKEAKQRGVKPNIRIKSGTTKKIRLKVEINEMLDMLYNAVGPCLGSRCLAWCGGEITDEDLFASIKEEAELIGKTFVSPW